jgi:phosphoglycolate phosphatase-like HAD superfamily hydrolase
MRIWLFDIDGTLISTGGAGQLAMAAALAEGFGCPADTGDVPFSGRTDRSIVRDLFALHQIDDSPEHWQRFVDHYLRLLPQLLAHRRGRVLPGVMPVLDSLVAASAQTVGLLTGNVPIGATAKLTHYQLSQYFAFGFYGDRHHHRDEVAIEARQVLRGRFPDRPDDLDIWVVGDTPGDIQCARAIGARVIAVATGLFSVPQLEAAGADLVVADLGQLDLNELDGHTHRARQTPQS